MTNQAKSLTAKAVERVALRHGAHVQDLVGKEIWKALVSSAVLDLLAAQDEDEIEDRAVRLLLLRAHQEIAEL